MSENNSSVNEETKNVIRGVTPPEPKLLGTYINMVPISESDASKLVENPNLLDGQVSGTTMIPENFQTGKSGNSSTTTNIPTSQFPMSAMNMEQLQQFMMRMQINATKDQTPICTANSSLGLGMSSGIPVQALGTALNVSNMIPSSTNTSYNIPPVGALDPNILASLGLNVQKPTLQPIQFPNMQAGVPNLCGIQGQDMNLATWMQKQKIALALSELQNNTQSTSNADSAESKSSLLSNSVVSSQNLAQATNINSLGSLTNISGISGIPGNNLAVGATSATQSQLTPQLAAFLGNPNLIPSKDANSSQTISKIPTASLGAISGIPGMGTGIGANIPGTSLGVGTSINIGNATTPESILPNMMQPTTDISKIEAMIKQQQQQLIGSQLNAAAQLLRQHGIQATIGTEPLNSSHSEIDISKNKKPVLLQKIVASKVNPRIFIVPNALNQDECDDIISLIQDRLEDSKISIARKENKSDNEETENEKDICNESSNNEMDSQEEHKDQTKNQNEDEAFCRSETACIQPEETSLIREIENRLGLLVESSNLYMEPILVHKYSTNDYIKEHHDGDTRTYTISVFLSDVDSGGELDFPYAGIKIKPKKGLAVVWPNINTQGKLDYTTVHAVNKITQVTEKEREDESKECLTSSNSSYLLYLHINKEPVRLGFEASQAMKQVVQSENTRTGEDLKVITQVTYPKSEDKKTKE